MNFNEFFELYMPEIGQIDIFKNFRSFADFLNV